MKINLFEGARRIALLIAAIWGIGVVLVSWDSEPYVDLTYSVNWPGESPFRTSWHDCLDNDRSEWDHIWTPKGTKVSLKFCFRAHEAKNGEMMVPYRLEGEKWWGADRYTSEVSNYAKTVSKRFRLPAEDAEWADSQWFPMRLRQVGEGALWLFGGWLFLWLTSVVVGWIVRGFGGIPMGHDHRPEKKSDN